MDINTCSIGSRISALTREERQAVTEKAKLIQKEKQFLNMLPNANEEKYSIKQGRELSYGYRGDIQSSKKTTVVFFERRENERRENERRENERRENIKNIKPIEEHNPQDKINKYEKHNPDVVVFQNDSWQGWGGIIQTSNFLSIQTETANNNKRTSELLVLRDKKGREAEVHRAMQKFCLNRTAPCKQCLRGREMVSNLCTKKRCNFAHTTDQLREGRRRVPCKYDMGCGKCNKKTCTWLHSQWSDSLENWVLETDEMFFTRTGYKLGDRWF